MPGKFEKLPYLQNRELSWLKFNERVLEEAACEPHPLLWRLRFIAIFTSNLDEFYMVRVGAMTDYMLYEKDYIDNKSGMSAKRQLEEIYSAAEGLYRRRDEMFSSLSEILAKNGVRRLKMSDLSGSETRQLRAHFRQNILPLLSPQIVDSTHPFPHLQNKQLHIAVRLEGRKQKTCGIIPLPAMADRIIPVSSDSFVLAEDLILYSAGEIFSMYRVIETNVIAVTRSADLNYDDDDQDIEDYRQYVKNLIKKRSRLTPVRLEMQYQASAEFKDFFVKIINMAFPQVLHSASPLDFRFVDNVERMFANRPDLLPKPHFPLESIPYKANIRQLAGKKDILLSFPYESFSPFLSLIRQASRDAEVVSIKITLYRIAPHSKLAHHLIEAAENGKEVVVLMELRARFDEDNNIQWAEHLEQAGCKVLYGLSEYKAHCKVCLITSIRGGKVSYITQVGTGNYNEKTSKQYTDLSLITASDEIGSDASRLFNNLLVGNVSGQYQRLLAAPSTLKPRVLELIGGEIEKARGGKAASVIIKCNSITDMQIIKKLQEASQAGVRVRLIVRGVCCLIPRVPNYTENVTVRSIVGTFLEHSRILCFGSGDDMSLYIGSADMMTRNTENRVEVACPVLDKDLKSRIKEMLDTMLADNVKAWELLPDGSYEHRAPGASPEINSQLLFTTSARMQPPFAEEALKIGRAGGEKKKGGLLRKFKNFIFTPTRSLSLR
jgi:polyphosphate kinase